MPPQVITSSVKWQDTCRSHLLKPKNDHYIHRNEHVSLPTLAIFGAPGLAHALSGSSYVHKGYGGGVNDRYGVTTDFQYTHQMLVHGSFLKGTLRFPLHP